MADQFIVHFDKSQSAHYREAMAPPTERRAPETDKLDTFSKDYDTIKKIVKNKDLQIQTRKGYIALNIYNG